jgi:hypothetical protein
VDAGGDRIESVADVAQETRRIRDELSARMPRIAVDVVRAIRRDIPFYATEQVVTEVMLRDTVDENLQFMVSALTSATFDTAPAAATGRTRAQQGVPIAAVMNAYRLGVHRVWQELAAVSDHHPELSKKTLLAVTQRLWEAQDEFIDAMSVAHLEQTTELALDDAAERAALADHLLQGRIPDDTSVWEIATILRIPTTGPYLAVAAAVPELGRQALPGVVERLRALDVYSAWRLLPDQQIGLVHAPTVAARTAVVDLFRRIGTTRIGVSAPFADLRDTPQGLRFARRELAGPGTGVSVFDGSVLGTAAIAAPETTAELARRVLSALYELPGDDSEPLFTTFRCWVRHDGNVKNAAAELFVHPNTVRHRLHRIEQLTSRSVTSPRDVAELCLAFEVDARVNLPDR